MIIVLQMQCSNLDNIQILILSAGGLTWTALGLADLSSFLKAVVFSS